MPNTPTIAVRVYVVACGCGTLALNMHRTYETACHYAQAHADLTGRCAPTMFADHVPPALAVTS
jgi:hypothetical protein